MDASSPRQPLRALKPWVLVPLLVLIASPGVVPLTREQRAGTPVESLPARLTDQEFWTLSAAMSEPNGYFRSENLVSNEHTFQYVVPGAPAVVEARRRVPGRRAGSELHLHARDAAARSRSSSTSGAATCSST